MGGGGSRHAAEEKAAPSTVVIQQAADVAGEEPTFLNLCRVHGLQDVLSQPGNMVEFARFLCMSNLEDEHVV